MLVFKRKRKGKSQEKSLINKNHLQVKEANLKKMK